MHHLPWLKMGNLALQKCLNKPDFTPVSGVDVVAVDVGDSRAVDHIDAVWLSLIVPRCNLLSETWSNITSPTGFPPRVISIPSSACGNYPLAGIAKCEI